MIGVMEDVNTLEAKNTLFLTTGLRIQVRSRLAKLLHLHIAQNLQHALGTLLFSIHPILKVTLPVVPDYNMFRTRNKAMFNAAVTTYLILVGTRVKETDIQRFVTV